MNPNGFCKSHGCASSAFNRSSSSKAAQNVPPEELTKCCEVLFAHLVFRILQAFRHAHTLTDYKFNSTLLTHRSNLQDILNEIQPYLDMLNELCALGTPIRKILVDYMTSESFYLLKCKYETMRKEAFKCFYENWCVKADIEKMDVLIEEEITTFNDSNQTSVLKKIFTIIE